MVRPSRHRVVVVGAGQVAESLWLPAVRLLGWTAVVVDVNLSRARELWRHYWRVTGVSGSLAEVGLSGDDTVVVATPPSSHAAVALEALELGARRIIVEKPPVISRQELTELQHAAAASQAALGTTFVRRGWYPITAARERFFDWRAEFGSLVTAVVAEGSPWNWGSVAATTGGAAALEHPLHDELSHPLDALFHITRWGVPDTSGGRARSSPWDFFGAVALRFGDAPEVKLAVRFSRLAVLANLIGLGFERGGAVIDMSPYGGVRIAGEGERRPRFVEGRDDDRSVPARFADLLLGMRGQGANSTSHIDPSEWAGPLSVVTALSDAERTGA